MVLNKPEEAVNCVHLLCKVKLEILGHDTILDAHDPVLQRQDLQRHFIDVNIDQIVHHPH